MKPGYKQSEVGAIPGDWDLKPLKAIAEKIMVGIASAATHAYRAKGIPMFRNQNIKDGRLDDSDLLFIAPEYEAVFKNKRLRGGDLLTMRTGYPGVTAVVPPRYEAAQTFTTLITRPKQQVAESVYLCHFINSETGRRFFTQSQIGGAQKNVNAGTLREMPVPLPRPHEQRAIAEALSDVDGLLGALDRLIAKKRDLKQAAMQKLLSARGCVSTVTKFSELASPRKDRVDPRRNRTHDFCIELECIESGTGRLIRSVAATQESSLKSIFHQGDVLFGKLRAYLRKYWLATRSGVCSTEIWVLAPNTRMVVAPYLLQLVQTDRFIDAASTAYGTHMPRSDWSVVKDFEVHLPSVERQLAVASVLSDMDAELAALEQRREKTRALKQGMMQQLLTGNIRLA